MNMVGNVKGIEKLKKILINDKHFNPTRLNEMLRSDIFNVLKNYMELQGEDIITKVDVDTSGEYVFRCKARTNRLKLLGILPQN